MNLVIQLYLPLTLILFGTSLLLHLLPRLGKSGKELSDSLCYAPAIDLVLAYFMLLPLIIGLIFAGWSGIGMALAAEFTALWGWIIFHELLHYNQRQQAKIARTMSGIVGKWRNHLAMWITILAVPCFWMVRFAQIVAYPPLTWLIGLPKYQTKDWINVSRNKFAGLVGYDLIWCLYCDWMTGVWSLGTEMLRNVESFWCPIKFYEGKKCANCQLDFPDIENGWVAHDGKMQDVVELLDAKYAQVTERSWFGHQSRSKSDS
ncbi:MAG TPA: hypothetical protein ACFCUY_05335 [Xenococcaceae cyanobacterium]